MIVKETIIKKTDYSKPIRVSEIVKGKVIAKEKAAVYLDLGPAGAGIIYGKEYLDAKQKLKTVNIEDEVLVKVIELENEDGFVEVSISQAGRDLAWETLKQKKENGEVVKIKVFNANKGGLLAEISGVSGFLPVSQLLPENYPRVEGGDSNMILKELQKFIGQEMEVTILDINPREEKLIFSEKAKIVEKIKENLKKHNVGDVVDGEITGVVDFGVFVRFGENIEGLIHISEMDWSIVNNPADLVKTGDKVKAKIIEIANDRVSLSLKALKEDPWDEIVAKHKQGDIVSGKATKLNPFGAFVQITEKVQGLCHISEFKSSQEMEENLKEGQNYDFEIVSIEPKEHRMSLRLKNGLLKKQENIENEKEEEQAIEKTESPK